MTVRILSKEQLLTLRPSLIPLRQSRVWQNPFYVEYWKAFWERLDIETLMWLYDEPLPSLVLYSSDLLDNK